MATSTRLHIAGRRPKAVKDDDHAPPDTLLREYGAFKANIKTGPHDPKVSLVLARCSEALGLAESDFKGLELLDSDFDSLEQQSEREVMNGRRRHRQNLSRPKCKPAEIIRRPRYGVRDPAVDARSLLSNVHLKREDSRIERAMADWQRKAPITSEIQGGFMANPRSRTGEPAAPNHFTWFKSNGDTVDSLVESTRISRPQSGYGSAYKP